MKHEHLRDTIPPYIGSLVSQTVARPIQWLWPDRIPQGRLTLLEGESGIGKSLLALYIAARISTVPTKGGVILITHGISDNDTIKPRLQAAGADLSRILLLTLPPRFTPAHSIASDIEYIETAIKDIGASLVIIDPLAPFLTRAKRASRSNDLAYLVHLAERTHCAFLLLRTISKPHSPSSLTSTGPLDLLDVLSSRLLILPDPQQPDQHLLTCTKHTLCAQPPTLAYRLTSQDHSVPTIDWLGESTHPNALAPDLSQPSTQRQHILKLLQDSPEALSPNDLTQLAEQTHGGTCKLLQRMLRSGLLVSPARGLYTLPNHPCLANYPAYGRDSSRPVPPATPDDPTAHPPVHSVHSVHTPPSKPDSIESNQTSHPPVHSVHSIHTDSPPALPDSLSDTSHPPVHIVHSVHTSSIAALPHLVPVPTAATSDPTAHPPVHTVHSVHTPTSDSLPTLPQSPIHTPIPFHTYGIWLSEIEAAIPTQERAT